jgi:hypothetical protein
MPIRRFINSSIKRLSPSVPILLAVVAFAAGCGGSTAVPPPSPASTPPPALPPTTAFVLTSPGQNGGTLWIAASTASGQTAVLPVNATTGRPGRAVAYLPGPPVAIGL